MLTNTQSPSQHKNFIPIPSLDYEKEMISLTSALDDRIQITANLPTDPQAQAVAISMCEDPETGFEFFCNNFVFIQDPEAKDDSLKEIPFLLYSYQKYAAKEIIKAVINGYDLPIEKSRKTGMSWLLIAILVWGWHFQRWECLVGSQKFENVDKRGNIKSLLEKARFILSRLPTWMIPPLRPMMEDKTGNLVHPVHKATIAGESNNTNFGRSDRRKVILFDEFASWEQTDKAAWQSCGSTTKCRIPLSTPNTSGTNCHFYHLLKKANKDKSPFLSLHWSLNPVFARDMYPKDDGTLCSPWYDEQVARASTLQEVAQELDINYEASMGGKVFPDFSEEVNIGTDYDEDLPPEKQADTYVEYNPSLPVYLAIDFGLDQTAIQFIQHDPKKKKFYIFDEICGDGTEESSDIYHYIDEIQAKPYKRGIIFCDPHSGENRSMVARGSSSNAKVLRKFGFVVRSVRSPVLTRLGAARNLISKVIVSPKCPLSIEMFMSWQLKTDSQVPKHDEFSHFGDAFSYFAVNYNNRTTKTVRKPKEYKLTESGTIG